MMITEKRYLVKPYGTAPNGETIYGIFDTETTSPYHLYAFNNDGLEKIAKIMNEQHQKLWNIEAQLVMFDMCDNWSEDRKMHFIGEIAEIMDYHGGI